GSSTLQNALNKPGRYTAVLRLGYLDLLRRAKAQYGEAPLWLQNFLLYELNYYVGREDSEIRSLAPSHVRDEFHALLGEITAELDPSARRAYTCHLMKTVTRDLLEHASSGRTWTSAHAVIAKYDATQGLVQLVYRYVGEAPDEKILLRTKQVVPHAAKTR